MSEPKVCVITKNIVLVALILAETQKKETTFNNAKGYEEEKKIKILKRLLVRHFFLVDLFFPNFSVSSTSGSDSWQTPILSLIVLISRKKRKS